MTRALAIAAKCRECVHDPIAAGTWREQVAVCGCSDCPLWRYRPLPNNAPAWITARDPDRFANLPHDEAIHSLRGKSAAKGNGDAVQAIRRGYGVGAATPMAGTP